MKQTTRTLITTLAALLAAAAIGLGALWVSRDETRKTTAKDQSAKLFAIDKDKARELRVEKGATLVAVLKRGSATAPWTVAEPAQAAGAPADEPAVSALIDKLATLKQKSEIEGMDPSVAGLAGDAAGLRLTLVEDGGKTSALQVGADNAFDQTTYVKRGGEPVVRLIAGFDKAPLDKNLYDLRDKRVARLDPSAEVRKVEVRGTPLSWTAVRDGASWKLASPAGPADPQTVDRALDAIKSLRATGIAAERTDAAQLKSFGLAPGQIAVKLTLGAPDAKDGAKAPEASEVTVLLGQPRPPHGSVALKTYARREGSPTVFAVDGQIVKDLSLTLFDLQDKSVAPFDRAQARRLDFAAPGGKVLTLAQKKQAPDAGVSGDPQPFEVIAPQKGPAKAWKVSGSLATLSNLRAAAFGPPAPRDAAGRARLGLDKPRTVTVFGADDKVLSRIEIGAEVGPDKKRRWVHAAGSPRVVEVEKGPLDDLPFSAADALEAPPNAPAPSPSSAPAGGAAGPGSAGGPSRKPADAGAPGAGPAAK